ncbi:hypothetical protein ACLOJK_001355 [Asimina triloba]
MSSHGSSAFALSAPFVSSMKSLSAIFPLKILRSGGLSRTNCSLSSPIKQRQAPLQWKGLKGPHQQAGVTQARDPNNSRAQATPRDPTIKRPWGPGNPVTPEDLAIRRALGTRPSGGPYVKGTTLLADYVFCVPHHTSYKETQFVEDQ